MKKLFLLSIILFCSGCASPIKSLYPPSAHEPVKSVYLVSHGWHTGIVIKKNDIPSDVWPEVSVFASAKYIEIGWGDEDFYQAPEITIWNKIKAALWPTSGVMHIAVFNNSVNAMFPKSEIIELEFSLSGFKQLCHYIHESYEKDSMGKMISLGAGLYGDSKFYLSREKYHIFKTCNIWTAKAIRSAGYPITPFISLTSESLMSKARKHGNIVQTRQPK